MGGNKLHTYRFPQQMELYIFLNLTFYLRDRQILPHTIFSQQISVQRYLFHPLPQSVKQYKYFQLKEPAQISVMCYI